jgi:hypothetical protein
MPKHTQHALITWIPNSVDGKREATRLHGLHRNYSVLMAPGSIGKSDPGDYMSTIVVGHREELIEFRIFQSLVDLLSGSGCTWLVLAACHGGETKKFGPLGDNELISPAQALSNRLRIKVSGTTRALTFDEVGKGYAFALTLKEILIRSNPVYDNTLWKDHDPQSDLEAITKALEKL